MSLTLTNGLAGLFSLGHPAFMTIGAYVAGDPDLPRRAQGIDAVGPARMAGATCSCRCFPALLAAGIVGAARQRLVGWPVLRLRGHYLAVATLGLIVIVQNLATNWDGITRGGAGLSGMPRLTGVWWAFGPAGDWSWR